MPLPHPVPRGRVTLWSEAHLRRWHLRCTCRARCAAAVFKAALKQLGLFTGENLKVSGWPFIPAVVNMKPTSHGGQLRVGEEECLVPGALNRVGAHPLA